MTTDRYYFEELRTPVAFSTAEETLVRAMPPGVVWEGDNMRKYIRARSRALGRVMLRLSDIMFNEWHPARTYQMLEEWETALGLPLRGTPTGDEQSLAQRRAEVAYWRRANQTFTEARVKEAYAAYNYDINSTKRVEPFTVNTPVEEPLYDDRWDHVIELLLNSMPGHAFENGVPDLTELREIAARIYPIPFTPFVRRGTLDVPDPVYNVNATAIGQGVEVEWTNPAKTFDNIRLEVEHPDGNHDVVTYRLPSSRVRFTLSGLTPGVSTKFNIWTIDSRGRRSVPVEVTATPLDTIGPNPISADTIMFSSGDSSVYVSWELPRNSVVDYVRASIRRADGTSINNRNTRISSEARQFVIFSDLDNSDSPVEYIVTLTAYDDSDNASTAVERRVWTTNRVLPPLQNLVAESAAGKVTFTWSYPLDVLPQYDVKITGGSGSGNFETTVTNGATSYELPASSLPAAAVNSNITYSFMWMDGQGRNSGSQSVTGTVYNTTAPSNPTLGNITYSTGSMSVDVTAPTSGNANDANAAIRRAELRFARKIPSVLMSDSANVVDVRDLETLYFPDSGTFGDIGYASNAVDFYMATGNNRLDSFDTNGNPVPGQSILLGSAVNCDTVAISGNILYAAEKDATNIYTVNIADPNNPVVNSTAITYTLASPSITGMAHDGTDLYLLHYNGTTNQIIKMSTSGTLDTTFGTNGILNIPGGMIRSGNVRGMAFSGNKLFMGLTSIVTENNVSTRYILEYDVSSGNFRNFPVITGGLAARGGFVGVGVQGNLSGTVLMVLTSGGDLHRVPLTMGPSADEDVIRTIAERDVAAGGIAIFSERIDTAGEYNVDARVVAGSDLASGWVAAPNSPFTIASVPTISQGTVAPPKNFRLRADGRTVEWDAVTGATGYEWGNSETGPWTGTSFFNPTRQRFDITGTPRTAWFRTVQGTNTSYAVPFTFTTSDVTPPTLAAERPFLERLSGNRFRFKWIKPTGTDIASWRLILTRFAAAASAGDPSSPFFTQIGAHVDNDDQVVASDVFTMPAGQKLATYTLTYTDTSGNVSTATATAVGGAATDDTTVPTFPTTSQLTSLQQFSQAQKILFRWADFTQGLWFIDVYEADADGNKGEKVIDGVAISSASAAYMYTTPDLIYGRYYIGTLRYSDLAGNMATGSRDFPVYRLTDITPPNRPTVTLIAADNLTAKISWSYGSTMPDSDIALFKLYTWTGAPPAPDFSDDAYTLHATISAEAIHTDSTHEYTQYIAVPRGEYLYAVLQVEDNTGSTSDSVSHFIQPSEHGPAAPLNASFTPNVNARSVTFTWEQPGSTHFGQNSDFVRARIIQSSTGQTDITHNAAVGSSTLTVSSLELNRAYEFKLYGIDSDGQLSQEPVTFNITLADTVPPAAPTGVNVINAAGDSLRVFWNNPTDIDFDGVRIRYGLSTNMENEYAEKVANKYSEEAFLYNLSSTMTYTVVVQSFDEAGNYSAPVTITKTLD